MTDDSLLISFELFLLRCGARTSDLLVGVVGAIAPPFRMHRYDMNVILGSTMYVRYSSGTGRLTCWFREWFDLGARLATKES